jgi:cephalosporin-C deacetylase
MSARSFSHGYGFDPTCGLDLAQLLAIPPPQPPDDFAAFWQQRHAAALSVNPMPRIKPTGRKVGQHVIYDLSYFSTGGMEIGGWLLIPEDGRVRRGLVIGHGYGGRDAPDAPVPVDEAVCLFPCFRGLGCSALPGVSPDPRFHVLHDIDDRQRYIIGGCVDDLWLAVSALLVLFPEVAGRVACLGISLGGGIGAMAAPWDTRINRLHLHVPTFGHQALRLTLPCLGSNAAVREYQQRHGNVMEILAYYDAATAARYLQIPVLVAAALFDPAVPPPGQFAVYNAIAEPLRRLFVLEAGHFDYPGKEARLEELNRTLAAFLMEPPSDNEDVLARHASRVPPLVQPPPAEGHGIACLRPWWRQGPRLPDA